MRIRSVLALGALLLSSIALAPGTTQAQDAEFTISPTSGVPGDVVSTQLDPAAIERDCIGIDDLGTIFHPTTGLHSQWAALVGSPTTVEETTVSIHLAFTAGAIAQNLDGASDTFLNETAILTFARINDQAMVGPRSNFDRTTGAGEITVPEELTPGLWGLAATCAEPNITAETAQAALEAGLAALAEGNEQGIVGTELIEFVGMSMLEAMMDRGEGLWFAQFTVPRPLPEADPQVARFCAAIPALLPVATDLIDALGELPEDDEALSDEEWAELTDWETLNAEIKALVDDAMELLAEGDESRPDELADTWEEAVGQLRQIYDALEAIEYDFSTPSGRLVAGEVAAQLPDDLTGGDDASGEPSATAVLTEWFMQNCTGGGAADDPAQAAAPGPAAAATPVAANPAYTG